MIWALVIDGFGATVIRKEAREGGGVPGDARPSRLEQRETIVAIVGKLAYGNCGGRREERNGRGEISGEIRKLWAVL